MTGVDAGADRRPPEVCAEDMDALDVLPLAIVPLATTELRQARIVKDAQLRGVVELWRGEGMGSGRVLPSELPKMFDLRGARRNDLVVIKHLCRLPSYDVFSLRVSLKELGIKVESQTRLRISEGRARALAHYLRRYTKPMLAKVYDDADAASSDLYDIANLVVGENLLAARANLGSLAKRLTIALRDIPVFIEEYGDLYMSLAFYQSSLDDVSSALEAFFRDLDELRRGIRRSDQNLIGACMSIESKFRLITSDIATLLKGFETDTQKMWEDVSALSFNNMKRNVQGHQRMIGGGLCAVTVKMNAWSQQRSRASANSRATVDFIVGKMQSGLDAVPLINRNGQLA